MSEKVVQKVVQSSAKVVQNTGYLGKNKGWKQSRKKIYHCEMCAYETINISNYKKHLKSKKHLKKFNLGIPKFPKKSSAILEKAPHVKKEFLHNGKKRYTCDFCNEYCKSKSGYYRHRNNCDGNPNNSILQQKIDELENKLNEKDKELDEKKKK